MHPRKKGIPITQFTKQTEWEWILAFVSESIYDSFIMKRQLRALWTSFCLRYNLEPDTSDYDMLVSQLWKIIYEQYPNECEAPTFKELDDYLVVNLV